MDCEIYGRLKRPREPFSDQENTVLVEGVALEWPVINSKKYDLDTVTKKRKVWQRIKDKVNAVGGNRRQVQTIRQQWSDVRDAALLRRMRQTQSEEAPVLPQALETSILGILGKTSPETDGAHVENDSDSFIPIQPKCEVDYESLEESAGNGADTPGGSWSATTAAAASAECHPQRHPLPCYLPSHNGWTSPSERSTYTSGQPDTFGDLLAGSRGSGSEAAAPLGRRRLRDRLFPFRGELDESDVEDTLFREWMRSEIAKNTEAAELYRMKKDHLQEVSRLKKRKMEMEIKLLEQQLLGQSESFGSNTDIAYE